MKQFAPEITDWGSYIEDILSNIPVGTEGLICLPYLMGERAPHWDAQSRGVFIGVRTVHTPRHFVRALMEGVIFSMYNIGEALIETCQPIQEIQASGGFARSPLWVQMMADIFGTQVILPESVQSSGVGATYLAQKALGIIGEYDELTYDLGSTQTFYPNLNLHDRYQKSFHIFKNLYPSLQKDFQLLNDLLSS